MPAHRLAAAFALSVAWLGFQPSAQAAGVFNNCSHTPTGQSAFVYEDAYGPTIKIKNSNSDVIYTSINIHDKDKLVAMSKKFCETGEFSMPVAYEALAPLHDLYKCKGHEKQKVKVSTAGGIGISVNGGEIEYRKDLTFSEARDAAFAACIAPLKP
jgi:hypothetical protein